MRRAMREQQRHLALGARGHGPTWEAMTLALLVLLEGAGERRRQLASSAGTQRKRHHPWPSSLAEQPLHEQTAPPS